MARRYSLSDRPATGTRITMIATDGPVPAGTAGVIDRQDSTYRPYVKWDGRSHVSTPDISTCGPEPVLPTFTAMPDDEIVLGARAVLQGGISNGQVGVVTTVHTNGNVTLKLANGAYRSRRKSQLSRPEGASARYNDNDRPATGTRVVLLDNVDLREIPVGTRGIIERQDGSTCPFFLFDGGTGLRCTYIYNCGPETTMPVTTPTPATYSQDVRTIARAIAGLSYRDAKVLTAMIVLSTEVGLPVTPDALLAAADLILA